jgi:hypothetical protein
MEKQLIKPLDFDRLEELKSQIEKNILDFIKDITSLLNKL